MNRTVIIGAIVVLLAAGGYYQFSYKPAQERAMVEDAAEKAAEVAAAEAAAAEAAATEAAAAAAAEAEAAAAAATEAVTEGTAAATEAVTDGAAAATDAAAAALDPANFNADAVVGLVDGSSLDDAAKATLKTAIEAARANPALVAETVAQVRAALGL